MASSKGSPYPGKQALLPPKCPFTSASDFAPTKAAQNISHHRASSESLLLEEHPSWLDDLLDEPETPVRKGKGGGHRRSSSDSFAYVHVHDGFNVDYALWDGGGYDNNSFSAHARGPLRGQPVSLNPSFHLAKPKHRTWNSSLGSSSAPHELEMGSYAANSKKDVSMQFMNTSEKRDNSRPKSAASEADTKRARQQFAQRSRIRKIQYIAELERNVQMLQVEGSQVSAELEFLNQQNLILSLENKALKKRLESLAQEQLIKYLEHDVLEKEIARLRALYQQQQQHEPQQKKTQGSSSHQRSKSRDLESQFMNLTLRP